MFFWARVVVSVVSTAVPCLGGGGGGGGGGRGLVLDTLLGPEGSGLVPCLSGPPPRECGVVVGCHHG